MTPGILPILLHPPSTEADRVKAIEDRGYPGNSRTCRIMIVESRSMNVRSRDAAKPHAPRHEIDPSAMSPVKPRRRCTNKSIQIVLADGNHVVIEKNGKKRVKYMSG